MPISCLELITNCFDLAPDLGTDAVPHTARPGGTILQRLRAAFNVTVIPAVEGAPGNAELIQCLLRRKVRLLDDPDNLELFGCRVSHSSSPPSAIMLFFSRRFSSVRSATASFSARVSRRRS